MIRKDKSHADVSATEPNAYSTQFVTGIATASWSRDSSTKRLEAMQLRVADWKWFEDERVAGFCFTLSPSPEQPTTVRSENTQPDAETPSGLAVDERAILAVCIHDSKSTDLFGGGTAKPSSRRNSPRKILLLLPQDEKTTQVWDAFSRASTAEAFRLPKHAPAELLGIMFCGNGDPLFVTGKPTLANYREIAWEMIHFTIEPTSRFGP